MGRELKMTHTEACKMVEDALDRIGKTLAYIRLRLAEDPLYLDRTNGEMKVKGAIEEANLLCNINYYGAYLQGARRMALVMQEHRLLNLPTLKGGKKHDAVKPADKHDVKALVELMNTGRVWLNPPYSQPLLRLFLERMAEHGNGIALLFNRCDNLMFHEIIFRRAAAMRFLRRRIHFIRSDGTRAGSPSCGSVLIAFGMGNARILQQSSLEGKFIWLNKTEENDNT